MEFVRCATQFHSKLTIYQNQCEVNAKSLLGILSMQIQEGDRILIAAEGADAMNALEILSGYF